PALKARRPKAVEPLPSLVPLQTVLPPFGSGGTGLTAAIGINDLDREPLVVDFEAKGPHWIVIGPPVTGKSTILRSLVLSLAQTYTPQQVAMVLVDPSDTMRRFYNFGGSPENTLAALPHVLATVSSAKELDEVVKRLTAEYDEVVIGRLAGKSDVFEPQDNDKRAIFVIIDHYDDIEPMNKGELGLTGLSQVGKGRNLHIVLGGTLGIMRASGDELRRRVESARYTLVLQDYETVRYMGARGNFSLIKEPPPGRGFQVKAVGAALMQAALPAVEGFNGRTAQEQLDSLIGSIRSGFVQARWSYFSSDLAELDKAIRGEAPAPEAAAPDQSELDAQKMMADLMASQAAMMEALNAPIADADPSRFATVVEPELGPDGQPLNGAGDNGAGNGANGAAGNGAEHAPEAAAPVKEA
ncbi:MAG: FtsK/SpoIIIE domain-containing protein, partial [Anaerolineales bacterium]